MLLLEIVDRANFEPRFRFMNPKLKKYRLGIFGLNPSTALLDFVVGWAPSG